MNASEKQKSKNDSFNDTKQNANEIVIYFEEDAFLKWIVWFRS